MEEKYLDYYTIKKFDELGSTNDYAKGESENATVIVAISQTKGKGRLGRQWENNPGDALTFSIFLKPDIEPVNASMVTLVAAMAVKRAIGDDTLIKWPNDVVRGGKKLVGILTEMSVTEGRIAYLIPGIGVNVNVKGFDGELSDKATSMYLEYGREFDTDEVLKDILEAFKEYYDVFLQTCDMSNLKEEYNKSLANLNEKVNVIAKDGFTGTALGINDYGELIVKKDNGDIVNVRSGEVSVRGIYGYV